MRILITGGTGYIGSALFRHLKDSGLDTDTVDIGWRGTSSNPRNIQRDYRDMSEIRLSDYQVIVHLAGYSSAAKAKEEPYLMFDNNLTGFGNLLKKLNGQRLIYASSASVYTTSNHNMYDYTKRACDDLAALVYDDYYALRFGSVSGPSRNMRTELLINSMTLSGMKDGVIKVANPHVRRAVLGINDLCRTVETLIRGSHPPGVYNLLSFNATVFDIAQQVARTGGWKIIYTPDTPTYDFTMENSMPDAPRDTAESLTRELMEYYAGV